MKKPLHLVLPAVAATLLCFSSCKKGNHSSEDQPASSDQQATLSTRSGSIDKEQADAKLEQFARALASALNDPKARSLIKKKALKRYSGDYEVLFRQLKEQSFQGGQFKQALTKSVQQSARVNSTEAQQVLEDITTTVPLLNIAVPVNIGKWQTERFTPLVAVAPVGVDERSVTKIKAFDATGKTHWLDAKTAPTDPVVVVGLSERAMVNADGSVSLKEGFDNTKGRGVSDAGLMRDDDDLETDPPCDGCPGPGTGGVQSPPKPCDDCYTYLKDGKYIYLEKFSPGNLDIHEGWFLGAMEFRLQVKDPTGSISLTTNVFSVPRNQTTAFYANKILFKWELNGTTTSNKLGFY